MKKINLFYKIIGCCIFIIIFYLAYRWDFQKIAGPKSHFYKHSSQTAPNNTAFMQAQADFMNAMAVFPLEKDFDNALEAVKKTGENAHLKITLRKSGTVIQRNFYHEIPVQITLIGSYQQIQDFMTLTTQPNWKGPLFIWKSWTLLHQFQPKTTVLNETDNNDLLQLDANTVFFYISSQEQDAK